MKYVMLALVALVAACSPSNHNSIHAEGPALRPLTKEERAQDFDQLLTLFRTYYGPYEYKERRLGLNIAQAHADLRDRAINAASDEEFAGTVLEFGARLRDGHVQIQTQNTTGGISSYKLPIVLTPIEGRAIIGGIDEALAKELKVGVGDEVLEVDGKSPFAYLPTILKYRNTARDELTPHFIIYTLQRPATMVDLAPKSAHVRLHVRTATGKESQFELPWQTDIYSEDLRKTIPHSYLDLSSPFAQDLNAPVAHRMQMGQIDPIFLTAQTQAAYKFVKVYPSDAARKAFGLGDNDKPPIWAAMYQYNGKNLLLVRQATYAPTDYKGKQYLMAYQALLSEFEPLVDKLVLDQTHNPGGSYCADFYDLFARANDRQSVQLMRADRKWINDLLFGWQEEEPELIGTWEAKVYETFSRVVEAAYDRGDRLSPAVPLFTGSFYARPRDYTWTKPMLVLIDELAGSCGDMFPMVVKANHRAKLFGQPTMGLGGNVEEVDSLWNSRIKIRMTRGLFFTFDPNAAPTDADFLENHGVEPDIRYSHTVDDFRAGFVNYVRAFSEAATQPE